MKLSLGEMIYRWQDEPAIIMEKDGEKISIPYKQFTHDISCGLTLLEEDKKHIAILADNSYEWMVLGIGILIHKDYVLVAVDSTLPPEDIKEQLEKADVDIIYKGDDVSYSHPDILTRSLEKSINEAIQRGNTIPFENPSTAETLKLLIFTSGTNSKAKAVKVDVTRLTSSFYIGDEEYWKLQEFAYLRKDSLLMMPLCHTFGIRGVVLPALVGGVSISMGRGKRYLLEDIAYFEPETLSCSPGMAEIMLKKAEQENNFEGVFGRRLHYMICGSAPFPKDIIQALNEKGIHIRNGYGQTECSPIANGRWDDDSSELIPNDGVEIKLSDSGEILVKSIHVCPGYYKAEEETEKQFLDGYWRTGDIGVWVDDNVFRIVGRLKEMIALSNGKKIFPSELEAKLEKFDGIKECYIEKLPDSDNLKAWIVVESEEYSKADTLRSIVKAYNREEPMYRKLTEYEVTDHIERNTLGKKVRR